LVVIGAGPGGYVAAIRGAQKGLKTAAVEAWDVGGTCLNRGCIPTKSMIHSAHLYKSALAGGIFGISAESAGFDFSAIDARKNEVVGKLRAGTEQLLKAHGAALIRGRAAIKSPGAVVVRTEGGEEELGAKHIIIATGSKPALLPERMQSLENVFTTDEALAPGAKFNKRILFLGGGAIGVEFASVYSDLGCEVTIVDAMERLLPSLDSDISKNIMSLFKKRGINVITPAMLQDIREANGGLVCAIARKGETREVACDGVLVCIGRKPVTDGLFMDGVNVALDNGAVIVNGNMQTNIPNIYAIGDCTAGSVQLAHAASAEGVNAVAHIVGERPPANLGAIPGCVYSNPEIATVGLLESEALARGVEVRSGKYLMSGNGKSIITNEDRGFVKLVFDAKTDVLLGAHLMCARATDIIGELTCAIANGLTAGQLASVVRPHPTYAEGISEAVEDAFGAAVHMAPKRKP